MSELQLKFLSVLIPHVMVSGVLIGLLLNALRRYECRADAIMKRMDENCEAELRKYDKARDEIRASLRAKTDAAIQALIDQTPMNASFKTSNSNIQLSVVEANTAPSHLLSSEKLAPVNALVWPRKQKHSADGLPTVDDLVKWPIWCQISLAVRATQRVWIIAETETDPSLSSALAEKRLLMRQLERAVSQGVWGHVENAKSNLSRVELSVPMQIQSGDFHMTVMSGNPPSSVADAVTAIVAACVIPEQTSRQVAKYAAEALESASNAAWRHIAIGPLIWVDFDILNAVVGQSELNQGRLFPTSMYGPLWPLGTPYGWPKAEKPASELRLEFSVPDDLSDDEALDFVKQLSIELCKLDVAGGGHGVAIRPPLEMDVPLMANNPSPQPVLV